MTTTSHLRITDGTTTLNFSSGNEMKLISYLPEISTTFDEPIREQFRVDFIGGINQNRNNYNAIMRLFAQARNYSQTEHGSRVYAEFDPGDTGHYWRSELSDGKVSLTADSIGWQWEIRLRLIVEWNREPYWDGELTQLPLTNASATNDLAGITVNNDTDATNSLENFVDLNAEDILGDLPSPVKIEMYNSYSSAEPADEIYIHHNVYSNPTDLTHFLEGEDASGAGVTPTAESGDGASEDSYAAIAWTATTETKIATWALSSAQLGYMAGGNFAIIARWYGAFPYSDCYLRLKLENSTGVIQSGDLKLITDTRELHWLDTFDLPPYLPGQSAPQGINLCLYGLRDQAGTHTINLDYLQLSPISLINGYKHFRATSAGPGVDYQEYFYYDETEGISYPVDGSSTKAPPFTSYGGPIMLIPNQDQRLYFLSCDITNGEALVEQTWTVKAWYRPRRSSI